MNLNPVNIHWPETAMKDNIRRVPVGSSVVKFTTDASFMEVNFAMRHSMNDLNTTPLKP
jgi:hypothetical protein